MAKPPPPIAQQTEQTYIPRDEILDTNADGSVTRASAEAASPPNQFLGDIDQVYNDLGGQEFLKDWAQDNRTAFIMMMKDIHQPAKNPISVQDNRSMTIMHGVPQSKLDEM